MEVRGQRLADGLSGIDGEAVTFGPEADAFGLSPAGDIPGLVRVDRFVEVADGRGEAGRGGGHGEGCQKGGRLARGVWGVHGGHFWTLVWSHWVGCGRLLFVRGVVSGVLATLAGLGKGWGAWERPVECGDLQRGGVGVMLLGGTRGAGMGKAADEALERARERTIQAKREA